MPRAEILNCHVSGHRIQTGVYHRAINFKVLEQLKGRRKGGDNPVRK